MYYGWLFVPFLSAFTGWLANRVLIRMLFRPKKVIKVFGFPLQGVVPKKQQELAENLGKLVSKELLSFTDLEQKITDPGNIRKLMPLIEEHIDHFLRVKLPKEMPVIGMFIGDRTINEMKTVFTAELEILFPVIMKNYLANLREGSGMEDILVKKLASFSPGKLEQLVKSAMAKEWRFIGMTGAVIGFLIGLLEILVIHFA